MITLAACLFLVTADTHSSGFVPELLETMVNYEEDASPVIVGDFVDLPGQWDRSWTRFLPDFWGVPGNHDDAAGFSRHVSMQRVICGSAEEPEYIGFGIDRYSIVSRPSADLSWAEENYPNTPWIVFSHEPLVSCIGHGGMMEAYIGRRLLRSLPDGSIVVSGHEHVFCLRHMEGWTQIVVSTGAGKHYNCADDLLPGDICERTPGYPTFIRLDPEGDDLAVVGLEDGKITERHLSILEGDGSWMW